MRSKVVSAIKERAHDATIQYLPHDSYIVVLPDNIAEEVAELEGVQMVLLLPSELKVSSEMLAEVHGKDSSRAATANRRASKQLFGYGKEESTVGPQRKGNVVPGRREGNLGERRGRRAERKEEDPRASQEADLSVSVGRTGKDRNEFVTARWQEGLKAAGIEAAVTEIADSGRGPVVVRVRGGDGAVPAVVKWLVAQGEVLWVERRGKRRLYQAQQQQSSLQLEHPLSLSRPSLSLSHPHSDEGTHLSHSLSLSHSDSPLSDEGTHGAVSASVSVRNASVRNANSVPDMLGAEDDGGAPLVWSRGIRGAGQVIAIADSGLDYDNCAFGDPAGDDASLISFCDGLSACTNPGRHRKIYSYRTFDTADVGDEARGHGTHVVGSAVANTLGAQGGFEMEGAAPDAKVAFEDGGKESATTQDGRDALRFPESLLDMFQPSQRAGINLHSNSWGVLDSRYEILSQEVDEFMYENPDFLVVFAAGNDGPGYQTIGAPAGSKNGISVGASENVNSVYPESVKLPYLAIDSAPDLEGEYAIIQFGEFGAAEAEGLLQNQRLVLMQSSDSDPTIGCTEPVNGAQLSGNVALIQRGTCFFQTKCANAEQAGAIGCVVYNNVVSDLVFMAASDEADEPRPVSIPSVFTSRNNGILLAELIAEGEVRISLPVYDSYDPANIAGFSSRGPTLDMRIKPDIVVTGDQILSTRSDANLNTNQCTASTAAMLLSGTSMSTPQVAGAAALVRQYFEDGFHVGGSENKAAGVTPSAALVKGIILHSGEQLAYPKKQTPDMKIFPDYDQGYGSIRLSNVLWFGDQLSDFKLSTWDAQQVADAQVWSVCVEGVLDTASLKVTLQWNDPPASLQAAYALVNDLDLSVEETATGQRLYGNALPGRSSTSTSAFVPQLDPLNNNEQVTWSSPTPGSYRVLVSGHDVAVGPQTFALVVTGSYTSASVCEIPPAEVCPGNGVCSGHGTCMPGGFCACEPTHSGADCSSENLELVHNVRVTAPDVGVSGWVYYVLPVYRDQTWSVTVDSRDETLQSDPDLFVAYNRLPTLQDFDGVDFSPGWVTKLILDMEDTDAVFKPDGLADNGNAYWVLGIYAYCCAPIQLEVTASYGAMPDPLPTTSSSSTPAPTTTTTSIAPTTSSSTTTSAAPTTTTTAAPTTSTTSSATTPDDDAQTTTTTTLQPTTTTEAPAMPAGGKTTTPTPTPTTTPTPPEPTEVPTTTASALASPATTAAAPATWTPQTPPSSASAQKVAFTLSLPMNRDTFLQQQDGYLTAVASTANVPKDSVYVTDVEEVVGRRHSRALLQTTSVNVKTEVVVADSSSSSSSSSSSTEVASRIATGGALSSALLAQGLPEGTFTVAPEAVLAPTDAAADTPEESAPTTTPPVTSVSDESDGEGGGAAVIGAAVAGAGILAVGGAYFLFRRMRASQPVPLLPNSRTADDPPPYAPPPPLDTSPAPGLAAAGVKSARNGPQDPPSNAASIPLYPAPGRVEPGLPSVPLHSEAGRAGSSASTNPATFNPVTMSGVYSPPNVFQLPLPAGQGMPSAPFGPANGFIVR